MSKISIFPSRTFSENRLFMLSKFGRSASRDSPMRFASSMSLERAVVLVFCDSVLDWAFEFVFSESFELWLDWWLGVARTSPSGIDTKLDMYIVCVWCVDVNDRLYHNYWSKTRPEYSIWENQLYHFWYPPWAQPYINTFSIHFHQLSTNISRDQDYARIVPTMWSMMGLSW